MSDPTLTDADRAAVTTAADVAREHARAVDESGSFPEAAFAALRAHGLLAPPWSVEAAAGAVSRIAAGCGSTGLVWAMHLALLEVLRRHSPDKGPLCDFVRDAPRAQPLIAGATSEAGVGGDIRRSRAAVTRVADGAVSVEKDVPFSSYASVADAMVVTARRGEDAGPGDQVVLVAIGEQCVVRATGRWDGLGMRGTSSGPAIISAAVPASQVLPAPFGDICTATMIPASHTLWAACWLGIASDAAATARQFLRLRPPSDQFRSYQLLRLAEVHERVTSLRALVGTAARRVDADSGGKDPRRQAARAAFYNDLKVAAADLAFDAVIRSFELVGAPAYLRDGESSLARHIRDVLSAKVMVSPDRIRAATGVLALLAGQDGND